MTRLEEKRAKYNQYRGEQKLLLKDKEEKEVAVTRLRQRVEDLEEARRIVQIVGQATQELTQARIGGVVSLALSSVFENPYKFLIDFQIRRNKTEVDLLFERNGNKFFTQDDNSGVGAIDIAAFGLRAALLSIEYPPKERFIVIDEPFKYLRGEENQLRAGEMVKRIAKDLGFQMLIVGDVKFSIEADRTFHFTLNKDNEVEVEVG